MRIPSNHCPRTLRRYTSGPGPRRCLQRPYVDLALRGELCERNGRLVVHVLRDGGAGAGSHRRRRLSPPRIPGAIGFVRLVTDKLGSYRVAHRDLMPLVPHDTNRYANNRAEVSHQPTRQRERQMRGFRSSDHAQRFLHVHGVIQNLFRVGRHRLRSVHHRMLRARALTVWTAVTAA